MSVNKASLSFVSAFDVNRGHFLGPYILERMFNDDEITNILAYPDILEEALSSRMSWIKTSDLAQEGINTEKMTLIHLLWLQHAGRLSLRMLIPSRESSSSGSISKD